MVTSTQPNKCAKYDYNKIVHTYTHQTEELKKYKYKF